MPLTRAQRQHRWRKRRDRREKTAAAKIDRRDAEILKLKTEIAQLRSGLRWCSGFAPWPTLQARDAKGPSGFRSDPLREDVHRAAGWIDTLVIDQPEPGWPDLIDTIVVTGWEPDWGGEWVLCRDNKLRNVGGAPFEWKGDPEHPQRSLWYLIARRVPLVGGR
jgi:hypothetical protein